MRQLQQLNCDGVAIGAELRPNPLNRVGLDKLPAYKPLALLVVQDQADILPGNLAAGDLLLPFVEFVCLGDTALERQVTDLRAPRQTMNEGVVASFFILLN